MDMAMQKIGGATNDFEQSVSKIGDLSRGWPEVSLFNSYYTKM